MKKQFGNSRLTRPWKVDTVVPLVRQRNAAATVELAGGAAGVVGPDLEPRRVDQAVELVLAAVATSTTTPAGVMRSTPRPSVSTRVTFGRLKVAR